MKNAKLQDFNVSEAAAELRIRREHVIGLLKSGALAGYDVTPPGAKRKSYRITRLALDAFKAERSAKQTKPGRRKFVAKQPADFVEYFS
jgi:hypothetical protein